MRCRGVAPLKESVFKTVRVSASPTPQTILYLSNLFKREMAREVGFEPTFVTSTPITVNGLEDRPGYSRIVERVAGFEPACVPLAFSTFVA